MQKYLPVIRIGVLDALEYRLDLALHLIKYALAIVMMSLVWLAVARQNSQLPLDQNQIISYFLGAAILYSLSNFHTDYIEQDIRLGGISKFLLKPISSFWYYWSFQFSQSGLETAIKIVTMTPMVLLLAQAVVPSWPQVALTILYLPVIFTFSFTMLITISSIAFWFNEAWAIRWSLNIFFRFLAGMFIPLSFMAPYWQHILWWLPFTHLASTPINVMMGTLSLAQGLEGLLILLCWLVAITAVQRLMWQRGLKHYESTGL